LGGSFEARGLGARLGSTPKAKVQKAAISVAPALSAGNGGWADGGGGGGGGGRDGGPGGSREEKGSEGGSEEGSEGRIE
jgi:hypothetical protein